MKHLYAGLIVGAAVAGLITMTVLTWWFLSLFVSRDLATTFTAAIVIVMLATTILDYVTER